VTVQVGDRERVYSVYLPESLEPARPAPVVLVFHGGGGNAASARTVTGFDSLADEEGFVVVYPSGSGLLADRLLTWNAGTCCGYAWEHEIDDVAFAEALLDDLGARAAIDSARIFAAGMSNGALMAYRLACELSGRFAAIGPVAGTQNVETCNPRSPVSVLHIHGSNDQHVPLEGGIGSESLTGVDFLSVASTIDFWREHDGCPGTPQRWTEGSIEYELYSPCEGGAAVERVTVVGGGHAWPGAIPAWPGGDVPTQEISATRLIWEFFAAHPR
jgi:polyhydroxybutyrate depolymerase